MKIEKQAKLISEKYNVDYESAFKAINKIINKEALLFAISGKMGSGKDTVGELITKTNSISKYKLTNTSYASPVRKEIISILDDLDKLSSSDLEIKYNVDIGQMETLNNILQNNSIYERSINSRQAMQFWGTEVRRKQNNNYWVNKIVEFSIDLINKGKSVYITDVRFPNEALSVTDMYGKIIRLEVPDEVRVSRIMSRDGITPTKEQLYHSSEVYLDNYVFEKVFNGTKDPYVLANEAKSYLLS